VWNGVADTIIVPEKLVTSSTGVVSVEVGSLPNAYAETRGAFGSNGFQIRVGSNVDREVWGGSIWSDGFTVTSATGSGLLDLRSHISGSLSGLSFVDYLLFVSSQPYDLASVLSAASANKKGPWALELSNSERVMFTGIANGCGTPDENKSCGHVPFENYRGPVDLTLSANVPFASGQTVYVLSVFMGGVDDDGGTASFLNSASFGISAPVGTTLQSLSSAAYVPAVPEPSVALLLLAGLALGFVRLRGRLNSPPVS
jgi:hypothetical protein